MYGIEDEAWKKAASFIAVMSGCAAGLGLILLAIMDTFRYQEEHDILLLVCLIGIVGSMVCTSVCAAGEGVACLLSMYCESTSSQPGILDYVLTWNSTRRSTLTRLGCRAHSPSSDSCKILKYTG